MNVKFNNLNAQWELIESKSLKDIKNLFVQSDFILGNHVADFEKKFADYIGVNFAVGVSNGTDALKLSAQSLDLSGSVIFMIPANTYIATIFGMEQAYPDAVFELIDCDEYHQLDITLLEKRLKEVYGKYDNIVIVPVHLYGYTVDMTALNDLCKKFSCIVIEDASQSHGAEYKDKKTGSFGNVAAFSLYPGKNLGAAGDAGIITTNEFEIYKKLIKLRNLGSEKKYIHEIRGSNHRMDTIQAIFLKHKLPYLDEWNNRRRYVASVYDNMIKNKLIYKPKTPNNCVPVHHIYPIMVEDRDSFIKFLNEKLIEYGIHYPTVISKTAMYRNIFSLDKRAYKFSQHMISLPIHPFMIDDEIYYVCETLNHFK